MKVKNISEAWIKSLETIYKKGRDIGDEEIYKEDYLVIEINDILEQTYHKNFQ